MWQENEAEFPDWRYLYKPHFSTINLYEHFKERNETKTTNLIVKLHSIKDPNTFDGVQNLNVFYIQDFIYFIHTYMNHPFRNEIELKKRINLFAHIGLYGKQLVEILEENSSKILHRIDIVGLSNSVVPENVCNTTQFTVYGDCTERKCRFFCDSRTFIDVKKFSSPYSLVESLLNDQTNSTFDGQKCKDNRYIMGGGFVYMFIFEKRKPAYTIWYKFVFTENLLCHIYNGIRSYTQINNDESSLKYLSLCIGRSTCFDNVSPYINDGLITYFHDFIFTSHSYENRTLQKCICVNSKRKVCNIPCSYEDLFTSKKPRGEEYHHILMESFPVHTNNCDNEKNVLFNTEQNPKEFVYFNKSNDNMSGRQTVFKVKDFFESQRLVLPEYPIVTFDNENERKRIKNNFIETRVTKTNGHNIIRLHFGKTQLQKSNTDQDRLEKLCDIILNNFTNNFLKLPLLVAFINLFDLKSKHMRSILKMIDEYYNAFTNIDKPSLVTNVENVTQMREQIQYLSDSKLAHVYRAKSLEEIFQLIMLNLKNNFERKREDNIDKFSPYYHTEEGENNSIKEILTCREKRHNVSYIHSCVSNYVRKKSFYCRSILAKTKNPLQLVEASTDVKLKQAKETIEQVFNFLTKHISSCIFVVRNEMSNRILNLFNICENTFNDFTSTKVAELFELFSLIKHLLDSHALAFSIFYIFVFLNVNIKLDRHYREEIQIEYILWFSENLSNIFLACCFPSFSNVSVDNNLNMIYFDSTFMLKIENFQLSQNLQCPNDNLNASLHTRFELSGVSEFDNILPFCHYFSYFIDNTCLNNSPLHKLTVLTADNLINVFRQKFNKEIQLSEIDIDKTIIENGFVFTYPNVEMDMDTYIKSEFYTPIPLTQNYIFVPININKSIYTIYPEIPSSTDRSESEYCKDIFMVILRLFDAFTNARDSQRSYTSNFKPIRSIAKQWAPFHINVLQHNKNSNFQGMSPDSLSKNIYDKKIFENEIELKRNMLAILILSKYKLNIEI